MTDTNRVEHHGGLECGYSSKIDHYGIHTIFWEEVIEIIYEYVSDLEKLVAKEIVDRHNQQKKCGITDVHRQAQYLYALRQELLKHF